MFPLTDLETIKNRHPDEGWSISGRGINTLLCLALAIPSGVFVRLLMMPGTQAPKWLHLHILWGLPEFTLTDSEMSAFVLSCWGLEKGTHLHTEIRAVTCVHPHLGNTGSNFVSSDPYSVIMERKRQSWTNVLNRIPHALPHLQLPSNTFHSPLTVQAVLTLHHLEKYWEGKLSAHVFSTDIIFSYPQLVNFRMQTHGYRGLTVLNKWNGWPMLCSLHTCPPSFPVLIPSPACPGTFLLWRLLSVPNSCRSEERLGKGSTKEQGFKSPVCVFGLLGWGFLPEFPCAWGKDIPSQQMPYSLPVSPV